MSSRCSGPRDLRVGPDVPVVLLVDPFRSQMLDKPDDIARPAPDQPERNRDAAEEHDDDPVLPETQPAP